MRKTRHAKRAIRLIGLILLLFVLTGCGQAKNTADGIAITGDTLKELWPGIPRSVSDNEDIAEPMSGSFGNGAESVLPKPPVIVDPKPGGQPSGDTGTPTESLSFAWDVKGIEGQPYLVAVNRACCTVTVYQKDAGGDYIVPLKAFAASVGKPGNETPTGRWNTGDRYDWCYMVDSSYGRYAIRIQGGYMFHSVCYFTQSIDDLEYEEYNKLGGPASLGCVRLCLADEKWLYDNCPNGFPVVIYDDAENPGPLGKPEPIRIDVTDEARRGWDPTDPSPENPWNAVQEGADD